MSDYVQPDFYRFSVDSLKLVNWVSALVQTAEHILDLGAGSGVIGIELSNFLKVSELTFLEAQKEFLPFLKENIQKQLKRRIPAEIIHTSFGNWQPKKKYDLIVCNPPYYLPGHGEINKDSRKHIARAFVIDDWTILLLKIDMALTSSGRAFMVIKKDPKILQVIQKSSALKLQVKEEEHLYLIELLRLNVD